ncbi:MAG TPA: histidinol dehydrogenase [Solirubrobacterales bacterium]|nr:histidinol dehydrogenase [Solirubrobacterales bacterium]
MKTRELEWEGPSGTAAAARNWFFETLPDNSITRSVSDIGTEVFADGDAALLRLTERFDGVRMTTAQMRIGKVEAEEALAGIDRSLRESLEVAAANIRTVAEAQSPHEQRVVELPQGQVVNVRELAVGAAGIYAPGGRAVYPSSVLMCAIPARVAGVERIVLTSPPGADGRLSEVILAAAALGGVDEIYAVGGAQAIFGLAFGTETIPKVDVVVGPGNVWVQEAKRRAFGEVGIDSYAGPSELMAVVGEDTNPRWVAADLCAQAEHGAESPLLVASAEHRILGEIAEQAKALARRRPSVAEARLATVRVPGAAEAIALANAFAPEHLELMDGDAIPMADRVTTAGCVFVGSHGATAFGDYAAGSNHVLPTSKSGRFAGPLGPDTFRRKISTVHVPADAAAKLAPHVDAIARAEGFLVHGESAMIRTEP